MTLSTLSWLSVSNDNASIKTRLHWGTHEGMPSFAAGLGLALEGSNES